MKNKKRKKKKKIKEKKKKKKKKKEEQKEEKKEEKKEEENVDPREKIANEITSGNLKSMLKPVPKKDKEVKKEEVKKDEVKKEEPKKEEPKKETTMVKEEKVVVSKVSKNKEIKRGRRETIMKKGIKEIFDEMKANFFYENVEGVTRDIDTEKLLKGSVCQFSNCFGCTFKINKKINKIILSNCEEINIICDSLISNFEIINSVKVKVQVDGVVNAFSIDGSTDCVVYLNLKSAAAQFVTSKSSEVRVRLAKEGDEVDYTEHLLPEQFVFEITPNRTVKSQVSDLYSNYK